MQNRPFRQSLMALLFSLSFFISKTGFSQISVVSSNGYAVNITVIPAAILPMSSSCIWGYNYNLRLTYVVTFSGSNIPAALYTLQGSIGCGATSHFFSLPKSGGAGTFITSSNQWSGLTNCLTATIASMFCNTAQVLISGPGINLQTVSFSTSTVLPVTLVDFRAARNGSIVKLDWSTVTEIDNDHFLVERSANGSSWSPLGKVSGAGNSSSHIDYNYTDQFPLAGVTQYRLRQVNANGTFSFSPIVTVQEKTGGIKLSIYPVPNTGRTLNIAGLTNPGQTRMTLYNISGVKIFECRLSSSSVELPELGTGIYMVKLKNERSGEETSLQYVQL